jgi:threonine/homoserine/homoserine lactone efflux protein
MLEILLKGIGSGLVLAMTIGPVFFALLRTSISRGFKSGAFLAGGIATSDALIALGFYFGISQIIDVNSPSFQFWAGFLGGIALLGLGLKHLMQPTHQDKDKEAPDFVKKATSYMRLFWQGVLLNMLNPFVYLFWLGLSSFIGANFTQTEGFVFLLAIILTVLSTDILKAYVANLLSNILTDRLIVLIDRISGLLLMIFGVYLLLYAFWGATFTKMFPDNNHKLPL